MNNKILMLGAIFIFNVFCIYGGAGHFEDRPVSGDTNEPARLLKNSVNTAHAQ